MDAELELAQDFCKVCRECTGTTITLCAFAYRVAGLKLEYANRIKKQ